MKRRGKKIKRFVRGVGRTALLLLLVYVGSYVANSLGGGYWLKPERDGKSRAGRLSLPNAILWQPRFGYHARYNSDWLGTLYAPLVKIDRKFFHRTRYITESETFAWIKEHAEVSDIHPRWRE